MPETAQRRPVTWLRWAAFVCLAVGCLGGFGYLFYLNDWDQTRVRERPQGYPAIPTTHSVAGRLIPTLYHFYSPDCPCSRFVLPEVEELAEHYKGRLRIVAVTAERDDQTGYPFPTLLDTTETLARQLGVFCTPQAVIVSGMGQVLYAGGYNKARLCADDSTAYVRLALAEILGERVVSKPRGPIFGCLLPSQE